MPSQQLDFFNLRQALKERERQKLRRRMNDSPDSTSAGSPPSLHSSSKQKKTVHDQKNMMMEGSKQLQTASNFVKRPSKAAIASFKSRAHFLKESRDYSILFESDDVIEKKTTKSGGAAAMSIDSNKKDRPKTVTDAPKSAAIVAGHKRQNLRSPNLKKNAQLPPKKRSRDDESSEFYADNPENAFVSSLIRKMFRYDPSKYRQLDRYSSDDRSMVASFRTIEMEEKRSAKLAREEDARELALIVAEQQEEENKRKPKQKRQMLES